MPCSASVDQFKGGLRTLQQAWICNAGVRHPITGPHSLRHLTVTGIRDSTAVNAPREEDVALVMGNSLDIWTQSYDLAAKKRSDAAKVERGVRDWQAWREGLLKKHKLGPSSSC